MILLAAACLIACANVLFVLRTIRIATGSSERIVASSLDQEMPSLSIIVPARDEERQIETCVASLLAQDYPDFEVVVVDDRSSDATPAILSRLAEVEPRVRVVSGEELPKGWVGKPWALAQGVKVARGDWFLFTDADTVHRPESAMTAASYALKERLSALSLFTEQILVTLAERAILPSIFWTIAFGTGPLNEVNDPARRDRALFNGQYLLVERAAYLAIGGHEAVRGEIAEDLELARRFKADGRFRTALVGAGGLVRTRMYRSFTEIWNGFVKNFALGARGRPWEAAFGIGFFAVISPIAPIAFLIALLTENAAAALIAGGSIVAVVAAAEYAMRRLRLPAWSGLWLPVGVATMVAIFATSVFKHARGGVRWRGRRYKGFMAA